MLNPSHYGNTRVKISPILQIHEIYISQNFVTYMVSLVTQLTIETIGTLVQLYTH